MKYFTIITLVSSLFLTPSFGAKNFDNPIPFETWKKSFKIRAINQGVTQNTLNRAFANVKRNPDVIVSDRRQPEFSRTFGQYISYALSETRVSRAREMYKKHKPMLDSISTTYGVEPHYLVAFWGLETNFGRHTGDMDVISSLATLSHDLRRTDFFEKELILALKIIQNGHATRKTFLGSWAGAFGQTQFMPSTFTAYAIDADSDGKKDLWNSKLDIFSSSANFLNSVGWRRGEHWGGEVKISASNFDWQHSGHGVQKTLAEWSDLGVVDVNGNSLDTSFIGMAKLILPAGASGPKFLVYTNFSKILVWNRSNFYALSVGLLANKILNLPDMSWVPKKDEQSLSRKDLMVIQQLLQKEGFYTSVIDGVFGSGSKQALKEYQKSNNLIADGYADSMLLKYIKGINNAL